MSRVTLLPALKYWLLLTHRVHNTQTVHLVGGLISMSPGFALSTDPIEFSSVGFSK